ncbi:helix-turn-helix transcriptional regulator [Hyphomonas oceanitis]|uniref:Helix-turn-helix domain-containing protein n=1 Tax=Hyphomonas oceanitis SCH89 TaxID=1280953 RepID=A0A059G1X5_9PROT|nr:helix-turn-helix domain-containing protein [Hyphomonas oceanitis]KCZ97986.1 hypothetical protein HOC_20428 [Hyphomonas oceanitis SCH89]
MQTFLTDVQLAERLAVSRQSIWRWVKLGHLPKPTSLGERAKRWPVQAIEDWEAERAKAS